MAERRRLGVLRALLLAASAIALSATASRAQDLSELNARILEHPQDTDLNLQYAHVAEQHGKLRLALAAYERVLINDPNNIEAQRGYERVRGIIEPAHTSLRVTLEEQWDSNPRDVSDNAKSAYSTEARATLTDERRFGAQRWRTVANLDAEFTPEMRDLNYVYLGAQTGPRFDVSPNVGAAPAIGLAVAALDNQFYFDEINLGVTFEGRQNGLSYWTRARAGWRDYSSDSTASAGAYVELIGGVSAPHIVSENDSIVAIPWVRWSDIEGSSQNFLNDQFAPGQYEEFGVQATYNYRLNDQLSVSIGAVAHQRQYSHTEINGKDRRDTYMAPRASLTLWNPFNCNCGVQASYQYRNNDSNDPTAEYDGRQFSVSLFKQF
jgi:hypothetical protein